MKIFSSFFKILIFFAIYLFLGLKVSVANTTPNQTDTLSPVSSQNGLPFRISIEQASFQLPEGFHSGVVGIYQGYWVFVAGRINGLHGFGPDPFPPDQQNTSIFVVDSRTGAFYSRALNDPTSGLNQQQIDSLSVTSPQGFQDGKTLYMTGGYGIDTGTGTYGTKPILTAINLPGIIRWVKGQEGTHNAVQKNIRQVSHPIFQITGGRMFKLGNTMFLVFGQNFTGVYTDESNGEYSEQVRRFNIKDTGTRLVITIQPSLPHSPNPNFRRRDLNVVPVLKSNNGGGRPSYALVAYAGVFTLQSGVWTVPVVINQTGNPVMADPNLPSTFKQAMNHYASATAGLYSRKRASMYSLIFGGISYGFYSNGTFQTDSEIPFINQVTTIKMDKNNNFSQYLMDAQYPVILSTRTNPGNTLLFGAGAYFLPNSNLPEFDSRIVRLDRIKKPTVIGYIVGGIQSTLPDTNDRADSAASPYVFKVTLTPV